MQYFIAIAAHSALIIAFCDVSASTQCPFFPATVGWLFRSAELPVCEISVSNAVCRGAFVTSDMLWLSKRLAKSMCSAQAVLMMFVSPGDVM